LKIKKVQLLLLKLVPGMPTIFYYLYYDFSYIKDFFLHVASKGTTNDSSTT